MASARRTILLKDLDPESVVRGGAGKKLFGEQPDGIAALGTGRFTHGGEKP